jgi:hypothetical protein
LNPASGHLRHRRWIISQFAYRAEGLHISG